MGYPFHADLWSTADGIVDLAGSAPEFGLQTAANGINARGQVVGYRPTAPYLAHAFRWEATWGGQ